MVDPFSFYTAISNYPRRSILKFGHKTSFLRRSGVRISFLLYLSEIFLNNARMKWDFSWIWLHVHVVKLKYGISFLAYISALFYFSNLHECCINSVIINKRNPWNNFVFFYFSYELTAVIMLAALPFQPEDSNPYSSLLGSRINILI